MNWNINEDFIFGFSETTNLNNIKKIYIFDLDNTIIKTKSKKKFPIDNNDWTWLYDDIPLKINSINNSINGIITNQRGLKSQAFIDNWIDKINQIIKKININFVFASIKHDKYSKPLTASWDFIINKLLFSININNLINNNKIYYIGDAAGRENDFSDTDIKFALNNKFRFKTPEQFLKINKKSILIDLKYPNFKYFTIKEQDKIFNNLFQLISSQKKSFYYVNWLSCLW
jgi:DNA 3'-phosphatase